MGNIRQDVRDTHLFEHKDEVVLLKPFLVGFDITWAKRRKAYNTDLSVYFLKPENFISQMFGFEHEVILYISDFSSIEPRTMQAAESIISDDPARGRVEQSIFFLITPARD